MGTRSDYYIRYPDGHISFVLAHSHDGYLFQTLIEDFQESQDKTAPAFIEAVAKMRGSMGSMYNYFPWPWPHIPSLTDLSYVFDMESAEVYLFRIRDAGLYYIDDSKYDKDAIPLLTGMQEPNLVAGVGDYVWSEEGVVILREDHIPPAGPRDKPMLFEVG